MREAGLSFISLQIKGIKKMNLFTNEWLFINNHTKFQVWRFSAFKNYPENYLVTTVFFFHFYFYFYSVDFPKLY
jgi:hypothetical protein